MKKIILAVLIILLVSLNSAFAAVVPPIRGNAGATSDYVDTGGKTWIPIPLYSAGNWGSAYNYSVGSTANPISGTDDDVLFQTIQYGSPGVSYKFDVANGAYVVKLLFAELYQTAAGLRKFDVSIEGTLVLDDYDIFADSGARYAAAIKQFNVNVADSQLNIDMVQVAGSPNVCGIEVACIPEPATMSLIGLGLMGLFPAIKKRRRG